MSKKTGKEININIDDVLVNSVRSGDIRYKIPGQSVICHKISRQLVENWKKNKIDVGELSYGKSVYILESVDNYGNIQGLYAGKTDIRKDGPIGRMCEHLTDDTSDLNGNKNMYWTTAYIFLVREDGQCVFERDNKSVDSLENALRNYLPKELCRTYRSSDEALGSFNTRVFNSIKAYIYKLIPDIFDEKDSKLESEVSNVKIDSKINTVNLYKVGDRIDNIVTPKKMVDEMLDELEKQIPGIFKHDVIFIDLACKGGEFIEAIYNRLFNSTDLKQIDSEIKRANYILKYQLYGVALNEYSYNETVNKLEDLGSTLNIQQVRDVEFLNLLDKRDYSIPISIVTSGDKDITYRNYLDCILQKLFKKDIRNIKWKGKEERMRIAVMIGNPPYQKNIPDDSNGFTMQAIYDRFMKLGIQCCDITSLIVPAKWTGDGKGSINELRDKVLHTGHLRHIRVINDSTEVFGKNVFTGGLTHFVYDNRYDGLTTVEFQDKDGTVNTKLRDLKLETGALADNRAIYIYNRIKNEKSLLDIVYGQIFDIRSNDYRVDTGDDVVRVLTNQGVVKMNSDRIPNKDCLGKYNTFVSHAISGNVGRVDSMGQQKIFGKHGILKPNEACSDTYLVIGNFDTIDEAINCDKYLCSKFVRLFVLMRVKSTIMSPKAFTDVPLQDFTSSSDIDWTASISDIDKQLYKKYNLSQEEIDYIERTIKPMA